MDTTIRKTLKGTRISEWGRTPHVALTMDDVRILLIREHIPENEIPEADIFSAFCCLNSWCYLFCDIVGKSPSVLATRIRLNGIGHSIKEAGYCHYALIHGCEPEEEGKWFYSQCAGANLIDCIYLTDYPKRLRLEGKDLSFMFQDYLASNRVCRYHQLDIEINGTRGVHTPEVLLDMLRPIINFIVKDWKQDTSLFCLPPGSTYEGHHTYLEKFREVAVNQQWLRERGVNLPVLPLPKGRTLQDPADCNRYSIVPKNFEKGRGIAPEPVSRQVLGYQVDSGLRQCLRKVGIDLNSQDKNREWCCSAFDLGLATVDLSAASDSISFFLVEQLFRDNCVLLDRMRDCRTNYIKVRGQIIPNGRFCTMGNTITFSLETIIFISVAVLTLILQEEDGPRHFMCDPMFYFNQVTVYGDDIILPDTAYETFVEIAPLLGFSVNTEKSFWGNQNYRESCGMEAFLADNGDVYTWMSQKYPRGTSKVGIAELVAMQHFFVKNGYINADEFVRCTLVELFPKMTQSEIGSTHQDIWCEFPVIRRGGHSPYGQIKHAWSVRNFCKGVTSKLSLTGISKYGEQTFESYDGGKDARSQAEQFFNRLKREDPYSNRFATILAHQPELVKVERPDTSDDDGYEYHLVIETRPGIDKVPVPDAEEVELLMYLMTLGNGIEHINSSEWTKPENHVHDRRDLCAARTPKIVVRKTL